MCRSPLPSIPFHPGCAVRPLPAGVGAQLWGLLAPRAYTSACPGPPRIPLQVPFCGRNTMAPPQNRSAIGGDQAHSNSLCHSFRGGHPGGVPKSRCTGALDSHPGPSFWVPSRAPLFRWESRCRDSFLLDAGTFLALLHCCNHSYPAGGSCSLHSDLHTQALGGGQSHQGTSGDLELSVPELRPWFYPFASCKNLFRLLNPPRG